MLTKRQNGTFDAVPGSEYVPASMRELCSTCGLQRCRIAVMRGSRKVWFTAHKGEDGAYYERCVDRKQPREGETYNLFPRRYERSASGALMALGGAYELQILHHGKVVETLSADLKYCIAELQLRGHKFAVTIDGRRVN